MSAPRPTATRHARALAILAVLLAVLLAACSPGAGGSGTPTPARTAVPTATPLFAQQPPSDWDGDTIPVDELPPEAIDTLLLVASDGPYPYDQDGSIFQSREGILPDLPPGYYREFTVETPGSPDRGARRLVVGDDGEVYYTDDHYGSFSFVVP